MYSAIFNGGILYKPQATKLIKRPNGKILYKFKPKIKRKLKVRPEYLEVIKKALIAAVNEPHGTGIKAKIQGITVAGKTGTAQVTGNANTNKIKDHAWFVGVAPVEDPSITVVVLIEHGGHGGDIAAPIAKELIKEYVCR